MRILVAGDYCTSGNGNRTEELLINNEFELVLGQVREITNEYDYCIVNLECPVVERDAEKIRKLGHHLKCYRKAVEALKWAGFDCVTLANNHLMDYGSIGVENTINAVDEIGLDRVGAGLNCNEAAKVLYKEIDGKNWQ